jgi:two-component system, chemotaxis family, protein-glutamate methylesterase/glutaminase
MASTGATVAPAKIRAVVCDDSGFMRRLVSDALRSCGVDVVGEAVDGREALDACNRLRPDVLTLDLQMPGMSGMDVLRRMGSSGPGVVVVSAYTEEGSALAVEALSIGAAEVIRKPASGTPLQRFAADLHAGVQAASAIRRRRPAPARAGLRQAGSLRRLTRPLVVIASSTGGPKALAEILPRLPSPCGAGVVIVQHMPAGFTRSLAERLDRASALEVREAAEGDRIRPDLALVAPGGFHLRLNGESVSLTEEPAVGGLRPRADLTIEDAARDWSDRVALLVLTGMGNDGTRGARAIRGAGGVVLAEAEQSCVVYGMPRAVAEAGLVDVVEPIGGLADALSGVLR